MTENQPGFVKLQVLEIYSIKSKTIIKVQLLSGEIKRSQKLQDLETGQKWRVTGGPAFSEDPVGWGKGIRSIMIEEEGPGQSKTELHTGTILVSARPAVELERTEKENKEILKGLEGRDLSSVEFVANYYQLRFNGPTLNVINEPKLKISPTKWLKRDDIEFCYYLVHCIGERIEEIQLEENSHFEIRFNNGFLFYVSLKPEDYLYNSPEALLYWDDQYRLQAVW